MREYSEHRGFTLIELLIVVALVGIIVSIAIPGLVRARMTSRETAAMATLRAVNNAQAGYASVCGNGAYAILFPTLAIGPRGSSTGFLSTDLTASPAPEKSGYRYALAAGADGKPGPDDCNGTRRTRPITLPPFLRRQVHRHTRVRDESGTGDLAGHVRPRSYRTLRRRSRCFRNPVAREVFRPLSGYNPRDHEQNGSLPHSAHHSGPSRARSIGCCLVRPLQASD